MMNINKIKKLINYMVYVDQYYRKNKLPAKETDLVDAMSTNLLKYIVEDYGWPSEEKVGEKCSHQAWLLIQHSHDLDFQEKCLQLMKPIGASKKDLAFLTDRVYIKKYGFQIYGTQVRSYFKEGKLITECLPIRNPEKVRELRKQVGLDTIENQNKRNAKIFKKLSKLDSGYFAETKFRNDGGVKGFI